MSCCLGEPRNGNEKSGQQAQLGYPQQQQQPAFNQWNGPITQQPGLHPPPGFGPPPNGPNGYPQGTLHGTPQPPPAAWMPNSAPTPPNAQWNTSSTNSYTPLLDPNILRPSPVHAQDFRASTVSPPPNPPSRPTSGYAPAAQAPTITQQTMDEGKMSVSIDFGTTFSGVAYGSSRIAGGKVQQILNWPGSYEHHRKIPTALLYDTEGRVIAWGLEAKNSGPLPGVIKCEWFKLFLEPKALRDHNAVDPRLPRLPPGKQAIDLIVDFLSALWEYAKEQITREIGSVADLNSADVWLTVPAAWDAKGCSIMRSAAITAGLVQSSRAGDVNWRDRLHIITEPEAAAVHCAHLTNLHHLKPSQNFMICDAGGGTVDLAVYKILGELQNLEIAELCARSGANCGSIFLDLRFQQLVRTLLADHPVHLDPTSLASFMYAFSNTDKLAYVGESQDDMMFHFTCFNPEDPDDPEVGLFNGELAIPGNLLRREVFDPVINQVIKLIEDQMKRIQEPLDALLMVGGFSGSEYLFKRVDDRFGDRLRIIARPSDADTATLRGAAQYGLARRPLVSTIVAPKAYIMKVKLPADEQDRLMRPAYITINQAGVAMCENRLKYLVTKGALVRKGQMIRANFCKYSQTPQDRMFVAVLYTSDVDKVMRYTDEGETTELCKWTVDLGSLPPFQQYAMNPTGQGFYTEFELGLELDSAEVRGVVLYEGREVGRVVFDFLS